MQRDPHTLSHTHVKAAYVLSPEARARKVPHPETLTRAVQVADLDPHADLSKSPDSLTPQAKWRPSTVVQGGPKRVVLSPVNPKALATYRNTTKGHATELSDRETPWNEFVCPGKVHAQSCSAA